MEATRYDRQRLLKEIGAEGQARLASSHAIVVGCGALGCVSADWLARAGVGHLTLIDRDIVEWSNLQRQTLFTEADAREGLPKAVAAAKRLAEVNSSLRVEPIIADLRANNVAELLGQPEPDRPSVIVDGCDNLATRYLLNDVAVSQHRPFLYAGAVGTSATITPIVPGRTPCLRCLMEDPPSPGSIETCDTAGVLGPVIGLAASLQAAQSLRLLVTPDDPPDGLIAIDAWRGTFRHVPLRRREDCPCCAHHHFEFLNAPSETADTTLCGKLAVQVTPASRVDLDLASMADRLAHHGHVRAWPFMLRVTFQNQRGDEGTPLELTLFSDGRSIVQGTQKPELARSIYARFVGT